MNKEKKKHYQVYAEEEIGDAIENAEHPDFLNLHHFSTKAAVVLKKGLEAMGIEIKPKTK